MSPSLITVSYLGAAALFILALGGLKANDGIAWKYPMVIRFFS